MTRRKSVLTGKKAAVYLERNGLGIRVEDVDAASAGLVAADLLEAFRALRDRYPEITQELQPLAGYSPLDVRDDDWAEDGRKAGFKTKG